MGFFGPSRTEKFIRNNSLSLGNYLKDNAVLAGGKSYANCIYRGIFPQEIDKEVLWYFWNITFAFRIAIDTFELKPLIDEDTTKSLWVGMMKIDKEYMKPKDHPQYPDTFKNVNMAIDIILEYKNNSLVSHALTYAKKAIVLIPEINNHEERVSLYSMIASGFDSFPSLKSVVSQNA